MKVISYGIYTGEENMHLDSEMLENAVSSSLKEPLFRLYGWSPRCISLGRNQNADFLSDTNEQVVRRLTGGRALLHDNEVTYSCVFPVDIISGGESIINSYKYISGIFIDFFRTIGIELEFGGKQKISSKFDYCMLISTGADVCYNGKKLIGSAQFRKNGYILQHGSILFDYDKKLLESLFKEPISDNSITCMKEICPDISKETFVSELEDFLKNRTTN